jgi:hypothetical protein
MSEIPIPPICKNCPTGEMLKVWVAGLDRLDASPCNAYTVCANVIAQRRDYCYNVWSEKYPDRAMQLSAEKAALLRQKSRHK